MGSVEHAEMKNHAFTVKYCMHFNMCLFSPCDVYSCTVQASEKSGSGLCWGNIIQRSVFIR